MYDNQDTIAAIATAPGEAAISIIRISGKDALKIANQIFSRKIDLFKSHTVHFGKILDAQKKTIDSVLLTIMLGPNTYSGENSIEIHCHGGLLVTRKVLERILEAGARAAGPGEFTLRAFLNKKIDLVQAEAVSSLISANNELALAAAENQLEGALSKTILEFQKELIDIAATTESWVDFSEDDLELENKNEIKERLFKLQKKMEHLSNTFHEGKILFEGLNLAIIGSPNVGKSSLMNVLCQKERAIVTPIPGTTRDTLEEKIILGKLHFNVIDTAGIRETQDVIEQEGIKRSKIALEKADIVLLVLDASKDLSSEDLELLKNLTEKSIIVWNKIDLKKNKAPLNFKNIVDISAKENIGIDALKEKIEKMVFEKGAPSKEEVLLTKQRHKQALLEAIQFCGAAINGIEKDLSFEFISSDVRFCLNKLSSIIGQDITEDILTKIFSKFCIGK